MAFQDFIEDSPIPQNPIQGAESEFQQEAPSFGQEIENVATHGITPKAFNFVAENAATAINAGQGVLRLPQEPKISANDINASAPIGNDGKPTHITDEPMYKSVSDMLIQDKQRQLVEENATARYSNANGQLPTFVAGMVGLLADPMNLAAAAYGGAILGGSKVLAGLGALGVDTASVGARVGARVISGAAGGAASMAPLAGAQLGISAYQGGDYDLHSALNDMAFGAVGGALIHGGFGSALHEGGILKPDELMRAQTLKTDFQSQAADILRQPAPVKAAAINSTIADVVNGRPADPSAVIGRGGQSPDLSQIADDRTQQNRNGYSPNMTPDEIAAARQTILPNGLKVEPNPSRLPDAEIDRYKGTVQTALQNAGVTNVDDSVVQEIARMKAEQINPEGAVKPRPLADVETGKPKEVVPPKPVEQTPIEVAPRAVPVAEPKLPNELSKSAPRWAGGKEVSFESDIDKALYIVGGKGKSPAHDKFVSFLTDKVGLTKQQIAQGALDVRESIKQNAREKTNVINVPKVFNGDKQIEITVPKKRTLDPMKEPMNALQLATSLGGIRDDTGDLRAMDAHKHFGYGGRLIRDDAKMDVDDFGKVLADRKYNGFNDENRPSTRETEEVIRDGLNGKHIYSEFDRDKLEAKNAKAQKDAYHEDLERHAGEMGIDTTGMKSEEIHAELEKQLREAADEHNALDHLGDEEEIMRRPYYPEEQEHANETIPSSAHTGHEPEVGTGNERPELEAGNEGGVQRPEPIDEGLAGHGTEDTGSDTGRTGAGNAETAAASTTFEPAKNVIGGGEQGILGGMDQSAKQAMAARGEKIGAKVEQKPANEGLFASVIGGGDQLDMQIAQAEKTINSSGMTVEERSELRDAYEEASDADKIYSDKLKELGQCLSENGV